MVLTKVYKGFQTVIPAKIREKHNIKHADLLEWETKEDKTILRKKEKTDLSSIIGIISDEKLDSLDYNQRKNTWM